MPLRLFLSYFPAPSKINKKKNGGVTLMPFLHANDMDAVAEILPVPGTPAVVARLVARGLALGICAVALARPVVLARDEESFAVGAVEQLGSLRNHKSLQHMWLISAKKSW